MATATTTTSRDWIMLSLFVIAVAAAAVFGAQFMPGEWYRALTKPAWTPPNWLFAPVWTALYIMIAIAGWLAWRADARAGLGFWVAQLVLNALWSWIFFGQKLLGIALIDITLMLAAIIGFITSTWSRSRTASLLFVPYLAWVSFATALNAAIVWLNR